MKAKMSKKQIQALECLNELTAYALQNKFPMRITDEMEECKKQISSVNVDWAAVNLTMEDLFNSIEQKLNSQVVQKELQDNGVPMEAVKEQIEKMVRRCHIDNVNSVDSMAEQKNTIIKMNCKKLMDISQTKVYLEEMENEDLYLQFFQNCKTRYERDSDGMLRELLQSLGKNCDHMMNHMESMFQSIDGYQNVIGNEKFYYEYEERQTGINQKVLSEIQTADIGGNDIISLGQNTKEKMKAIVKKLSRKKRLLVWLPFLILLGFLTIGKVNNMIEKQNETKQAVVENEDSSLKETVDGTLKVFIGNLSKKITGKVLSAFFINLISWSILIALPFVLIYLFYLKRLKVWYNHQIHKRCGEYLRMELIQFEQTNQLSSKLDTVMKNAVEEYERQYMYILDNLFNISQNCTEDLEQTVDKSEFDSLRAGWIQVQSL